MARNVEDRRAQADAEERRARQLKDQLSQQIGTFFENVEKYQLCEVDEDVRRWALRSQRSPGADGADDSDEDRDLDGRLPGKPTGPLSVDEDGGSPLQHENKPFANDDRQRDVPTIDVDEIM